MLAWTVRVGDEYIHHEAQSDAEEKHRVWRYRVNAGSDVVLAIHNTTTTVLTVPVQQSSLYHAWPLEQIHNITLQPSDTHRLRITRDADHFVDQFWIVNDEDTIVVEHV